MQKNEGSVDEGKKQSTTLFKKYTRISNRQSKSNKSKQLNKPEKAQETRVKQFY